MKNCLSLIGIISITALTMLSCTKSEDSTTERTDIHLTKSQHKAVDGMNSFGIEFFKNLSDLTAYDNMVISPFSMQCALLMAAAGEKEDNENYTEIMSAIGRSDADKDAILSTYQHLLESFVKADKKTDFSYGNSFWIDSDFGRFSNYYSSLLSNRLNAQAYSVPFNDEESISKLNNWISDATHGKITNTVDDIRGCSVILVNALFLDGNWKYNWGSYGKLLKFRNLDGGVAEVNTISTKSILPAYEGNGYKACQFPLGNGNFAVTIVLPDSDIRNFVSSFDADEWNSLPQRLDKYTVDAYVPTFKEKFKFDDSAIKALKQMGINKAFTDGPFSLITEHGAKLYISKIIQEANIDLNKDGLSASAATVVEMFFSSSGNKKQPETKQMSLWVDKPFIYIVHETSTNTILFAGIKSRME